MSKKSFDISDYIPFGKENQKTQSELCRETGLNSRDVRHCIHNKRMEGFPIVANNNGYWITEDPSELAEYLKKLEGMQITYQLLREAMKVRQNAYQ